MKKILKKIICYSLTFCMLFQATGVSALTKEENVYVKLNEKGEIQNTSITEHLYDFKGNKVSDRSQLNNIKSINGNEKSNQKGDNLVWETNGNDIYYQGSYNKDLPVNLNVK